MNHPFHHADSEQLTELRQQMISFARLQLSDDQQAEDVVQEALAGALKNAAAFNRTASLKTWVFAILKNKIADALRGRYRQPPMSDIDDCKDCSLTDDQLFDEHGHWHKAERPQRWDAPEQLVHDEHFWRVFDRCLDALPSEQARVFMMREFIELDSQDICSALELSTSNLHVLLYRARLRLRECLEDHWFGAGETT
ncbi:MAG: sigma-70 family RNA polymerase sigma factor [Saccharospirillaceae bacterium]|nr:sigma-70 family RNA polymerase sigma factor [Saccharospirillaceae bacterium]MCD8531333.1 sigma-70 family RNA polymerase sigma factor [Saccharospirillaceae bacterium]